MRRNKKIVLPIMMLLLLIVITIGVTYAAFNFTKEGTIENTLETGTVVLTYTEGKTGIILNEVYPMSDEQGKLLTGENNVFDFTVQANLSRAVPIFYEVTAVKIPITDMTPLEDDEVRLYLERAIDPETLYQSLLEPSAFIPIEEQTFIGSPEGSMILDSGVFINQGTTIHHYRLRMWVDKDADLSNGVAKKYGIRINVYAKQELGETTDETCFTFDEETATITGYSSACPKEVSIPYTINGIKVTTIGNRAFFNQYLTKVKIPNTVTAILDEAFYGNQLTEIKLPDHLTTIGITAFRGNQITKLVIPNSVTKIGAAAFTDNQINDLTISNHLTLVDNLTFSNNKLTTVTIPNSVTSIAEQAFSNNLLETLTIPDSVTSIGSSAFYHNQLTSLTIPKTVTSISGGAFNHNQLKEEDAFFYARDYYTGEPNYTMLVSYGGAKKDNVIVPDGVIYISDGSFANSQLTSITLPNTVGHIGNFAFSNNQLTTIDIPYGVETIKQGAFANNQLTTITLPNTVKSIEYSAFSNNQLTVITLPNSLLSLGQNCFANNKLLKKIINKTGRDFSWEYILNRHCNPSSSLVTGTLSCDYGDISITNK